MGGGRVIGPIERGCEAPRVERGLGCGARDPRAIARAWHALAVGALALSGLLAFGVVAARVPALARHWSDPELARRVLVVHVDLGIVVWFTALPSALVVLLGQALGATGRAGRLAAAAPWAALGGALLLVAGLWPGAGAPHAVNYVPWVDGPLHWVALPLLALGVLAAHACSAFARRGAAAGSQTMARLAGGAPLPAPVAETLVAVRAWARLGSLYLLAALAAFALATLRLPPEIGGAARSELRMWGGGHLLQHANVAFLLVAWALLASWASGRRLPLAPGALRAVAVALALPLLPALPLLAADPAGGVYRAGFTRLMQWGLFPAPLLLVLLLLPALRRRAPAGGRGSPPAPAALAPLAASLGLLALGCLYGALARGPDLRIPGHYHAAIGAITLAYMALALLLPGPPAGSTAEAAEAAARRARALRRLSALYGSGQALFTTGLVIAGAAGLGRKTYGVEQQLAGGWQTVGLAVMAVGGALALAGGASWAVSALGVVRQLFREAPASARGSFALRAVGAAALGEGESAR